MLDKIIVSLNESFDSLKEWTDLGNWLQKLAKALETNPTPFIPKSRILSKRLSQCLSDGLPLGIHKTTLSIYKIILNQMKTYPELLLKKLSLYSIGLFPFLPRASLQVFLLA